MQPLPFIHRLRVKGGHKSPGRCGTVSGLPARPQRSITPGFQETDPENSGKTHRASITVLALWLQFSSVQSLSPVRLFATPMDCSTPGLPVHHQLTELTETHVHRVGEVIQSYHPLSSPSPPALNLPQHQVFSSESALHIRWPKYWSFSFSISPSNEYSGLTSFSID